MGIVRRGIVRTADRAETVRMGEQAETARDITGGIVRRGTVRTADQAETVRVITGTVRRAAARTADRIVQAITGITTAETVQTITGGIAPRGIVRMEGREAITTVDAATARREDVRTAEADRAEGIRLVAR